MAIPRLSGVLVLVGLATLVFAFSAGRTVPAIFPPLAPVTPLGLPEGLSGAWEGHWKEVAASQLHIVRVSGNRAMVVYGWQEHGSAPGAAGLAQLEATVTNGVVGWQYAGAYRFWLADDGAVLLGTRVFAGKHAEILMRRLQASAGDRASADARRDSHRLEGIWQGIWRETYPTRLVLEVGGPHQAGLLYRWEDDPRWGGGKTWVRLHPAVRAGKIAWRYGGDHMFQPSPDGRTLLGTRQFAGKLARVTMLRSAPVSAPPTRPLATAEWE